MNTRIEIMYRDAANYKKHGSVVLTGRHTPEQADALTAARLDGEPFFVPETLGMDPLREGWDDEIDHAFHTVECVEATDDRPTDPRTVAELLAAMEGVDWEAEGAKVAARH